MIFTISYFKLSSLKEFGKNLKVDRDLSPEEKFELYYDEHEKDKKKKNKPQSLDKILNAQTPVSQEPLELMFIVAHQSSELWFKVLIHELNYGKYGLERRR